MCGLHGGHADLVCSNAPPGYRAAPPAPLTRTGRARGGQCRGREHTRKCRTPPPHRWCPPPLPSHSSGSRWRASIRPPPPSQRAQTRSGFPRGGRKGGGRGEGSRQPRRCRRRRNRRRGWGCHDRAPPPPPTPSRNHRDCIPPAPPAAVRRRHPRDRVGRVAGEGVLQRTTASLSHALHATQTHTRSTVGGHGRGTREWGGAKRAL